MSAKLCGRCSCLWWEAKWSDATKDFWECAGKCFRVDSQSSSPVPEMFWILRLFHRCPDTSSEFFYRALLSTGPSFPHKIHRNHTNDTLCTTNNPPPPPQEDNLKQNSTRGCNLRTWMNGMKKKPKQNCAGRLCRQRWIYKRTVRPD